MDESAGEAHGSEPQQQPSAHSLGNPYFDEADLGEQHPLSGELLNRIFQKLPPPPTVIPPGRVLKPFQVNAL
jgi:hypothetical protein